MSNILTANSVKYSILVFGSFILGNLPKMSAKNKTILLVFSVSEGKPRVCFKCGQQHENKQCMVDKPKCANCKGEHPSSSKTCPKKNENGCICYLYMESVS
jgi:hypothetical protein